MTRHSSLTIKYKHLITFMEAQKAFQDKRYETAKGNGVTNLEALRHNQECARVLVKMLKRCEPGKQADLFELFKGVNK